MYKVYKHTSNNNYYIVRGRYVWRQGVPDPCIEYLDDKTLLQLSHVGIFTNELEQVYHSKSQTKVLKFIEVDKLLEA